MKKFLTVLLALSVVFTYSFGTVGSVFAATVDKTPIAEAQQAGYTAIDNAAQKLLDQFTFNASGELTAYYEAGSAVSLTANGSDVVNAEQIAYITKDTVKKVIDEKVKVAKEAVQKTATEQDATVTTEEEVPNAVAAVNAVTQTQINALAVVTVSDGKGDLSELYKAQESATRKVVESELKAYTTTQYSDDTDEWSIAQNATYENKYSVATVTGLEATSDLLSAKTFVEKMLAKMLTNVESAAKTNADTNPVEAIRLYKEAAKIASDIINGYKGDTEEEYIAPVPTKDDLASDTTLAEAKTKAINKISAALKSKAVDLQESLEAVIASENKLAKPDTDKIAAANDAIAGLDAQIAAIEDVYEVFVNTQTTVSGVNSILDTVLGEIDGLAFTYKDGEYTCGELDTCVERVNSVAALKAYAEQVIALVDRESNPYFDEAAVRDVLEKQVEQLYLGKTNLSDAKAEIRAAAAVNDDIVELKSDFIANVEGTGKALTIGTKSYAAWNKASAYEDAQLDAFNANVSKTKAAIESATSYTEIKEAYLAGCEANEDIITIAQHRADWEATGDLYKEYAANYKTDLEAYQVYAIGKLSADAYSKVQGAGTAIKEAVEDIVEKAYTKDEIPTQVAAAKAYLDDLKSDAELDAAKSAVEAKITALKTPVTVADKDQILDARDSYDAYIATPGADPINNALSLQNAVKALAALELQAINDAAAAIEKTGVTVDSEDAINALADAIEAYNDNYDSEIEERTVSGTTTAEAKLDKFYAELNTAQLEYLAGLCAALPINPTSEADVEAINAAKAAYDALDIHQKAEFVTSYELYYDKLSQALNALENSKAAMKLMVQGTHVKIWSSSGKGYIQIRWDQNDNGVTLDGYEVYRSTKKTTGFSKISTFKVQKQKTYKINMKKGTKYYFKVKGYKMVGDEKVYTHDSITVYRTFR